MGKQLFCKNIHCKGTNFKQIAPDKFECLSCGQIRTIKNKTLVSKKVPIVPKESIGISKDYTPVIAYCELCGEKIDRIGHPRDEKRFNNKWANHVCQIDKKQDNFYS